MLKNFLLIVVPVLLFFTTHAQIPEGGGLRIIKIMVPDPMWGGFKVISPNDSMIKIRSYALELDTNDNIRSITPTSFAKDRINDDDTANAFNTHIYLPYSARINGNKKLLPDQRLELIYKADTMTIDFFDIPPPGESGDMDSMDTLTFYRSHYLKCYRDPSKKLPSYVNPPQTKDDPVYRFMQMGITNHTIPLLYNYLLVEDADKPVMMVFQGDKQYDTLWLPAVPVYTVLPGTVDISAKKINISTAKPPLLIDSGKISYKFYQAFSPSLSPGSEEIKMRTMMKELRTIPLYINGKRFTGVIKWLLPFRNSLKQYWGTWMIIHEFREGVLISERNAGDVDPDTEMRQVRPA